VCILPRINLIYLVTVTEAAKIHEMLANHSDKMGALSINENINKALEYQVSN
jgi:hypothetical protein